MGCRMLQRWGVLGILLALSLANSTWSGTVRCTTSEEKTLHRRQTICDDGTQAVSRYNRIVDRWETTITTSPRKVCVGRMDPSTKQVEVRCR
jgi:hypothetical protein